MNCYGDSPIHPIIDCPHQFDIIRFDYICEDSFSSHLDLTLKRGYEVRRLRFIRPRCLRIEEGFPSSTRGMIILDIRHRQWDGIGVEVADFEGSNGSITFLAADVVDLDEMVQTNYCSE